MRLCIALFAFTLACGCAAPTTAAGPASGQGGEVASHPAEPPATGTPTAPVPSVAPASPVSGFFLCGRVSLCSDADGHLLSTLSDDESVLDPSIAETVGVLYFVQNDAVPTDPTGRQRIFLLTRVPIEGGPETIVAEAGGGATIDSPVISADGKFLADVETSAPSDATAESGAHIVVRQFDDPSALPTSVPADISGAMLPAASGGTYKVLGWSPDDRILYYFAGASSDIRAVTFDAGGAPIAGRLIFHAGRPSEGCADGPSQGTMSPDGDIIFRGFCQPDGVRIFRLHGGELSIVGFLPQLGPGWIVGGLVVDNTGREVAFSVVKKPGQNCPAGQGTVRIVDNVVVAAPTPGEAAVACATATSQ